MSHDGPEPPMARPRERWKFSGRLNSHRGGPATYLWMRVDVADRDWTRRRFHRVPVDRFWARS
jgi:hypothetical protein